MPLGHALQLSQQRGVVGERGPALQQGEGVGGGEALGFEGEAVAPGHAHGAAMPQHGAQGPEEEVQLGGSHLRPDGEGRYWYFVFHCLVVLVNMFNMKKNKNGKNRFILNLKTIFFFFIIFCTK